MEDIHKLLDVDIITRSQFYDSRRKEGDDALRRLMFAVLRDALICLSAQIGSAVRPREVREAVEWFAEESDDYPFSFNSVCEYLGINPTALRQGLKAWLESGERVTRRSPVIPLNKVRVSRSVPINRRVKQQSGDKRPGDGDPVPYAEIASWEIGA